MKIAICDDEQPCIDRLLELLNQYSAEKRLETDVSTFTDPVMFAQSELASLDIVFLDANMGEVSGIEVARILREVNKTAILVYVSAFVEYAPMGYEVNAFRYLMKHSLADTFAGCMDEVVLLLLMRRKKLILDTADGGRRVLVSEVLYIESFRHQILFHLADGTVLETRQGTLLTFTKILAPHGFLRIHKSFLVNPEHIVSLKNKTALLDNGHILACSKQSYAETLRVFLLWKGSV